MIHILSCIHWPGCYDKPQNGKLCISRIFSVMIFDGRVSELQKVEPGLRGMPMIVFSFGRHFRPEKALVCYAG